jgi:hypothetical protein
MDKELSLDILTVQKILPKLLKGNINEEIIQGLIVKIIKNYNKNKNTDEYDNCVLLIYIIEQMNIYIKSEQLMRILNGIVIIKNETKENLSLLDYVYRNKLFFDECDLVTILWKNKVVLKGLNSYYLTFIFDHYSKCNDKTDKDVMYHLIKNCKIIELLSNTNCVIDNLIHMFNVINKEDYHTYKSIYMSFEEYDNFYIVNKSNDNIKYFMIDILFFTMLEKINYKSMHKLIKTMIYNRELLSYLRGVLRQDPTTVSKYKSINEIAKESVFINSEHQILLNKMIDIIFDFDTSTTTIMNMSK